MDKRLFSFDKITTLLIFVTLIGVSIDYCLNMCLSINDNLFASLFVVRTNNINEILKTIWQVQSTLVTLIVALLTIIANSVKDKIFGIRNIYYLSIKRVYELNFWDEIAFSVLLILIGYFFMTKGVLIGLVIFLAINCVVLLHLLYSSLMITMMPDKAINKIKEFLFYDIKKNIEIEEKILPLKNQDFKNIINLHEHTIELINSNNLPKLNQNINFLVVVFVYILKISNSPNKSEILSQLVDNIYQIINFAIKMNMHETASNLLRRILVETDKFNQKENKYSVPLEGAFEIILNELDEIKSLKSINQLSIEPMFFYLYKNLKIENGFYNYDLPNLYKLFYRSILHNEHLNNDEKDELIREISKSLLLYTGLKLDDDKVLMLEQSILKLSKEMIDNYDIDRIKIVFDMLFVRQYVLSEKIDKFKIAIIISTYLYYLAFKEGLVKESEKYYTYFKLQELNLLNAIIGNVSKLWDRYNFVKNELKSWEKMEEGKAKFMIMEYVVDEFFLFLSTCIGNFNLNEINYYETIFGEEKIFRFLNAHLHKHDFGQALHDEYKKFNKWLEIGGCNYDLEFLKDELLLYYKKIQINKANIEYIIKNDEIRNSVVKTVLDSPYVRNFNVCYYDKVNPDYDLNMKRRMPIYFVSHSYELGVKVITENLSAILEKHALNNWRKQGFVAGSIHFSDKCKLDELFCCINKLNTSLSLNTLITGITHNSSLIFRESDINKNYLKRLENEVDNLEYTKNNIWVIFDNSKMDLLLGEISMHIDFLSEFEINEILNNTSKDENYFYINVTNEIYVPFKEEEAKEYLKLNYRNVYISVELDYNFRTKSSGCIFNVEF